MDAPRPLALLAVAVAGGCGGDAPVVVPDGPVDVGAAFRDCVQGDLDAGLAGLDAAVRAAPGDPDALVARGLCRWRRSAASGDGDARGAYRDLSDAIDAVEAGAASRTPLDQVYSHRAYVAQTLDGGWTRTLEDLDHAVRLAPRRPGHVLDRGVAHAYAGDTLAARRDLERYLAADSLDDSRRRVAQAMLDDLDPVSTVTVPR